MGNIVISATCNGLDQFTLEMTQFQHWEGSAEL